MAYIISPPRSRPADGRFQRAITTFAEMRYDFCGRFWGVCYDFCGRVTTFADVPKSGGRAKAVRRQSGG